MFNIQNRVGFLGALAFLLCLPGCKSSSDTVERLNENGSFTVTSSVPGEFYAFRLPEGRFRNVLWPSSFNEAFQIRVIKRNEELILPVMKKAPNGQFLESKLNISKETKNRFKVSSVDETLTFSIEVPHNLSPWSFYFIADTSVAFLVVCNLSDTHLTENYLGLYKMQHGGKRGK